jgi:hypothetical protein
VLLAFGLVAHPAAAAPAAQAWRAVSGGAIEGFTMPTGSGDSLATPLNTVYISGIVWYDSDHDGYPDGGESGIDSVLVRVYSDPDQNGVCDPVPSGTPVGSEYTGPPDNAQGAYSIEVPYWSTDIYYCVYVDQINFGSGFPLEGLIFTSADTMGPMPWPVAVSTTSVGEIDFGYVGVDWGDLPDPPYPTLLTSNGPRHVIASLLSPLVLGSTVDAEFNGQPDPSATGDDLNGRVPDDEDGVTVKPGKAGLPFWTDGAVSAGQGGSLEIVISGGSGVPQVFIDFPNDLIGLTPVTLRDINALALPTTPWSPGTYRVYFDVPAGAMASDPSIAVRVRLSSAGGLSAIGGAPDGEVEDYIFPFKTTSVAMASFSARPAANVLLVGLGGAAFVIGLAVWGVRRRAAAQPL